MRSRGFWTVVVGSLVCGYLLDVLRSGKIRVQMQKLGQGHLEKMFEVSFVKTMTTTVSRPVQNMLQNTWEMRQAHLGKRRLWILAPIVGFCLFVSWS